MAVTKNY